MEAESPYIPRCGDTVRHRPTGETWEVAFAEGNDLAWFGWPDGRARLSDCEIVERCSDEEHQKRVSVWLDNPPHDDRGNEDSRVHGDSVVDATVAATRERDEAIAQVKRLSAERDEIEHRFEKEEHEHGKTRAEVGRLTGLLHDCAASAGVWDINSTTSPEIRDTFPSQIRAEVEKLKTGMARRRAMAFDFLEHLHRQAAWSQITFGPGERSAGVIDHIRKELREIEAAPNDPEEWVDVLLLACDGAMRIGVSPEELIVCLEAKLAKNMSRRWPDWRTTPADKAIEHVRLAEEI